MSFDLFVGLPASRIVWAKDLIRYYDAETDWDAHGEQPRDAILPALSQFALELAKEWPPLNAAGPLDRGNFDDDDAEGRRYAEYRFGPTSIYLSFGWSWADEALEKVRALAVQHNLLFFNCSGRDWTNAMHDPRHGRAGQISVFESKTPGSSSQWAGKITWIEPQDAELLTAPDRFGPDFYFTCELGPNRYMQAHNSGEHYAIEYRDGSPDLHYRATTTSLEKIRQALSLYFRDDRQAFQLLNYQKLQF